MEIGTYKGRRVDFGNYATSRFNPFIFTDPDESLVGCGPSALGLITGIKPTVIAGQKRTGKHTSDRFMVQFLRARGFRVLKLTHCNLSASPLKLGFRHVVLLSQLFRKGEATWGVFAAGIYLHNFEVYNMQSLSLLSKPVVSAFLVIHDRWRDNPSARRPMTPKVKKKSSGLTLKSMGFKDSHSYFTL